MLSKILVKCICLLSICGLAYADNANTTATDISQAVIQYFQNQPDLVQNNTTVSVGKLDPRISLSKCPTALIKVSLPEGISLLSAHMVSVRCENAKPWSLFVPISLKHIEGVVIARKNLEQGKILGIEDLEIQPIDVFELKQGYFTHLEEVQGLLIKHSLAAGLAITPRQVAQIPLVKRGDLVSITAHLQGVSVSLQGMALTGGVKGDIIPVRNTQSNRVIQAQIAGIKQVQVVL